MIISNIEIIPGKKVKEHFGLVHGNTVQSKHLGTDFLAGIKNIFGGELKGYTELLETSRKEALDRMIQEATHLGADAIVNVRFSTSSIAAGAAEILVYGSAVKLEDRADG